MPALELIRWIATLTMVADHVGVCIASPDLRAVGRVAFPLFAWMVGYNGQRSDATADRLTRRLLLWSLISQPAYMIWGGRGLNVMPTLLLGLVCGRLLCKRDAVALTVPILVYAAAYLGLPIQYGLAGVLSVAMSYAAGSLGCGAYAGLANLAGGPVSAATAALTPIFGRQLARQPIDVPRLRYFGYAFYPLHLLILTPFRAD